MPFHSLKMKSLIAPTSMGECAILSFTQNLLLSAYRNKKVSQIQWSCSSMGEKGPTYPKCEHCNQSLWDTRTNKRVNLISHLAGHQQNKLKSSIFCYSCIIFYTSKHIDIKRQKYAHQLKKLRSVFKFCKVGSAHALISLSEKISTHKFSPYSL